MAAKKHPFKWRVASDRLLEELPRIAPLLSAMRVPESVAATYGDVDPKLLQELSLLLQAIVRHQPAGKLFRQDERKKPKKDKNDLKKLALVYEFFRAATNIVDDSEAIKQIKAAASALNAPPSPASIKKNAQSYRTETLDFMEKHWRQIPDFVFFATSNFQHLSLICSGHDNPALLPLEKKVELSGRLEWKQFKFDLERVQRLRAHYDKKSPHGDWDRALPD